MTCVVMGDDEEVKPLELRKQILRTNEARFQASNDMLDMQDERKAHC